jgi:hypothetical protein
MHLHLRHPKSGLRTWLGAALVAALLLANLLLPASALAQGDDGEPQPTSPIAPTVAATPNDVDGLAATRGTTINLPASKDTFISSNLPNTNFAGLSNLDVGWFGNFNAVRILIKFKLDGIPANAKIYGAQLVMYLDSALPANDGGMRLNYARATQDWDESGATWNSASGIGGSQSQLGTVGTTPGWASFDLTNQVQQWVNGQSNHGMIIIGDETPSLSRSRIFRSREVGGSSPYLLVNYECDTLAPATFMNGLPWFSPGVFTASWGGQDRAPSGCTPSGIRKHHVQYQINGGPWVDWKSTTSPSATFDNFAPNGAAVVFRTWADDNAGNVEQTPSSGQTGTTIVSQAPAVTFTPLPQYTNGSSFQLSWSAGSTPATVTSYDVQYQVNGGAWMDLITQTPQTTFQFTNGQNEQTYGFRARARDNLGNVGQYPPGVQTQTTVVLFPLARMDPFNPDLINSSSPVTTSFTLNWEGQTPPGTNITEFDVFYRVYGLDGVLLRDWARWRQFEGGVTNATFPIALGNGIYQFEVTATNNQGQTTPRTGNPEAVMVVDRDDTISIRAFLSIVFGNE